MKKLICSFLIILLSLSCVFAYQKTYRLSSDEVQDFLLLRKVSSSITPDPTYPISASQLSQLVKSLDTTKITGLYKVMYDELLEELDTPEVLFGRNNTGYDLDLSVLGIQYVQGKDTDTYKVLPYKDRLPMGEIKGSIYMTDNAFGLFDFDFRKIYEDRNDVKYYTIMNVMDFGNTWPSNAYFSVGNDKLNLILGRDRLGSGNGYTGNLELGENSLYQDFAKFSVITDLVSYDFTINSWRYNPTEKEGTYNDQNIIETKLNGPKKSVFLHRISLNLFDFADLSIYEGALVYSETDFVNLKILNPFMFMHNTGSYYDASTNNFAGFEVVANLPFQNLQLDAQVFLDQIVLPGGLEDEAVYTGENAFAALLNLSKTFEFRDGIADVYAEAVYGNPYVYLKNRHGYGLTETDKENYRSNLRDLVVDNTLDFNRPDSRDPQYLGYKYGGDLVSFGIGGKYQKDNKLKLSADFQYLAKGDYGIRAGERREALGRDDYGSDGNYKTYKDIDDEELTIDITDYKYVVQTSMMFNIGAEYKLYKGVDVAGRVAYISHTNYQHDENNKNANDLQFAFSVNIKPLDVFDKFIKRHSL